MAAPPIIERHLPHFHRRAPVKEAVRAATTASITIATDLNAGDTIDGVTLAAGDRVLVKSQGTGSQNGIYVAGPSPARDYDESSDDPSFGYLVYVREGTANGGTLWKNTNTAAPTIGSTALTFSQFSGGGLTDPMTTRGDLIVRDPSNVSARLGIGAAGKILSSDGTDVSWGNGPMTTQDDLIVGGASGIPTRLGKGSDGDVLTVDPTTHHLVWAAPGTGGTMSTVKDEGSTLSGAVVSIDFVGAGVTATGTTAVTVTIPGGGGSGGYPLDRSSLDGTYGDEFDGASLNGRWTRHNQTSGEESYQQGGAASALRVAYSTGTADRYIYQTAPNGTNETWECCLSLARLGSSTGQMFALLMVDTSGNGVGALMYDNAAGFYMAAISSHQYLGIGASDTVQIGYTSTRHRYYMRLRKASGVYYGSFSFNGETYSPELSYTPTSFTPARVGVGRVLGTAAGDTVDWFWFDKTA